MPKSSIEIGNPSSAIASSTARVCSGSSRTAVSVTSNVIERAGTSCVASNRLRCSTIREVAQVDGGEVDRDPQLAAGGLPGRRLLESELDDVVGERADRAAGLGVGEKLAGRQQLPTPAPAKQRLDGHGPAGDDVDLRLVVKLELAPVDAAADRADDVPAAAATRGEAPDAAREDEHRRKPEQDASAAISR